VLLFDDVPSISRDHLGTASYDGNMTTGLTGFHDRNISGLGQLSVPPIISMSPAMSASLSSPHSNDSLHSGNLNEEDGHLSTDIFAKSTSGMELEINHENAANSYITGGREDEEVGNEHGDDLEGATDQGVDGHYYDEEVLDDNALRTPKGSEDEIKPVVKGKGIRASSDSEIYIEPIGNFRSPTMRSDQSE